MIAAAHMNLDSELCYKYDDAGKQVWQLFSNEMTTAMNLQWETGHGEGPYVNMSQDKRTMVRYVTLYINCGYNNCHGTCIRVKFCVAMYWKISLLISVVLTSEHTSIIEILMHRIYIKKS